MKHKVINIFYNDTPAKYETGLILELEDWTIVKWQSDSSLAAFSNPSTPQ
jgi:hypothetical protein